jgi:hypothetical protein
MSSVRERVIRSFPTVLLTLLSIIQAVALEVLWEGLGERPHLWAGGLGALIGWLQVSAVFCGIFVVWLFYTSLVMRVVWLPGLRDNLIPFVIGLSEFVLADMLAPADLHLWFYLLAWIFAFSTFTSTATFKKARLEPGNEDYFRNFDPSTAANHVPAAMFVSGLVLMGLLVQVFGPTGRVALFAVVMGNLALGVQLLIIRNFWRRSIEM